MASNPITPAPSVSPGNILVSQADGSLVSVPIGAVDPTASSYPYTYNQEFIDTAGFQRSIPAGFNSGLTLQAGIAFPPGYPAANNPNGFATGFATGTEAIRIQPPPSGSGLLTFETMGYCTIDTRQMTTSAVFLMDIGTTSSSVTPDPGHPMYPYEGRHSNNLSGNAVPMVIPPGTVQRVLIGRRIDIVHLLGGALAQPNWPVWTMTLSPTGYYPALNPQVQNLGTQAFLLGDIWMIGVAV